ncbi:MAG: class I SAM-dependent methyltransferase [Acidobacteria bacterium]|nr:class I SAM-dependent methyltransferase [Acidobacteriota bacterium]
MSMHFARRAVFRMLENLRHGTLEIVCPDTTYSFGEGDLCASIRVHHERFFSRVLWGGADAAGDSYMDGDWSSPDPVAAVRLAVRNLRDLEGANPILTLASRFFDRLRHRANRNSIAGSQRNIHAHYDLSNAFFRLFLDRSMVYSSAVYEQASDSLEKAQSEKLDRICRKLRLDPSDHVLEIGTGWGAFALHASRNYGCKVTTTTISRQQYDQAGEAFAEAGEAGTRIRLLLEDYRNLKGSFTKLVSIEMFEAVGLEYYDAFFSTCDRLLTPDGSLAMQTITMNEHRFDAYSRRSDWIQKRIFPGGQLASVREILNSLVRSTHLSMYHLEDLGLHYAATLAEWRRRFHQEGGQVRALGFDESFCRMWDYYLASCEGTFRERHVSVIQLMLTKNGNQSILYGEPWRQAGTVAVSGASL